jgi:serine/threonine protein kinase
LKQFDRSLLQIFIVLELITGGELFDKIVADSRFGETEARFYFRELIRGVKYCHSQGPVLLTMQCVYVVVPSLASLCRRVPS